MNIDESGDFPSSRRHFGWVAAMAIADLLYLHLTGAVIPAAIGFAVTAFLFGRGLRLRTIGAGRRPDPRTLASVRIDEAA